MRQLLIALAPYRAVFLLFAYLIFCYVLFTLLLGYYRKWKKESEERAKQGDKYAIRIDGDSEVDDTDRQNAIRQMLALDGVDPSPNSYLCISDGGRELYARAVTLSRLPKRVEFERTFRDLFAFPNSSHTVFVDPIDNETISRKMDKQINVLESEEYASEGNRNRVRRLSAQRDKTEHWAEQVEDGHKRFFYVGFLFIFYAASVDELNRITDDFRALALNKKMDISNCYGVQPEAFMAGLPLNRRGNTVFKRINSDCVKMFLMDQEALSTILNYTTDHFSHKHGIPLGRNLFNGQPYLHDIFDPSHFGYTTVICGKTFSGKSATIKMIIERTVPLGYRYVIIDSQTRKGTSEGEYSSCTLVNGGTNYQISSRSDNVLNLFAVQEKVEWVKDSADSGHEVVTLDLNSAITEIVYNIRTLLRGNVQEKASDKEAKMDMVMDSDINDIITRIVKDLFAEREIEHGNAESLYEEGSVIENGVLQAGIVPKELPTVTNLYEHLIIEKAENENPALDDVYRFLLANLRENVRELFYTDSGLFFDKEDYDVLEVDPDTNERLYEGEVVHALHGIRPYYDGQSTFSISRDCPVTNIDISQLTEVERRSARDIALHIVDQEFVQKNSERLDKSDKLVVIIDEAHESFVDPSARTILSNEVRTARKRNGGLIFSTQTVQEFLRYPETKDILEQAAVKMIFKQDASNITELTEPLNITESQANIIMNYIGVSSNKDDASEQARHRGEMCVIDGGQVQFVKVDYLRKTEALSVETDASSVMRKRE